MSPTTTSVGAPVASAMPRAVDTTPSIPFAPRLAWPTAAVPPNHSRSRIGIEAATTSRPPAGRWRATSRATSGSLNGAAAPSARSMTPSATAAAAAHRAAQVGSPTPASASARLARTAPSTWSATRWSGSITPGPPTCTTGAPLAATHWASTFDVAGRPMRTITSGRSDANPGWRRRASATAIAPGISRHPDTGSASSGQPVAATKRATSAGGAPAAPASTRPRRRRSRSTRSPGISAKVVVDTDGVMRRRGGRAPAVPTSGSRKGTLRWTGPVAAAANARAPSERHIGAAAASGTPGSWNQRTDRPNRWVWSIAWGAPTSRSSGGRSAVITIIGTSDRPASTTAGWKLAAAVPLVHTSTAGTPSSPAPRATKAATRSSWTTCTASSARSVRARATGVLREPGATMATRTPRAISSSTRAAQHVACTSAGLTRRRYGVLVAVTSPSVRSVGRGRGPTDRTGREPSGRDSGTSAVV